ncbi:hypothetical protein [Spirosoma oryzicola]|uniref:hypothetical protein n=1 Tax=Spirosoma oryzicola TaxID=2898794 RepID=UPI001E3463C7|nr:hypothetical protein [Spirosoma oryzicola]UHG93430.1 hypothetical protein LQ777_11110 [Spirosoma oryzicola]
MAAIQEYDYVPGTIDGVACWLRVTLASGCSAQSGMVNSTEIVYTLPDSVAGFQWKTRECPADDDIVVTSNPADFTPDGTTPTTPDPVSSNPADEVNAILYTSDSNDDGGPKQ